MNPTTRMFSRRAGEHRPCDALSAIALHSYRQPLAKRLFYALLRWGWAAVFAGLAALVLTGCADDLETHAAMQADLADAIAQAAKAAAQPAAQE